MRRCLACGIEKPTEAFGQDASRKDGRKERCKPCRAAARRAYVAANRDEINRSQCISYRKHHVSRRAKAAERYERDREVVLAKAAEAYRQDSAYAKAKASERRAKILRQTLPLSQSDQDAIVRIYKEAERLTAETGVPHEVDHDVPLCGREVAGLHVPWNLVVRTRTENRRKSNRLVTVTPEMVG